MLGVPSGYGSAASILWCTASPTIQFVVSICRYPDRECHQPRWMDMRHVIGIAEGLQVPFWAICPEIQSMRGPGEPCEHDVSEMGLQKHDEANPGCDTPSMKFRSSPHRLCRPKLESVHLMGDDSRYRRIHRSPVLRHEHRFGVQDQLPT